MARDTQVDSSLSLWNSLTELMKIDCENELARATVSVCEQIGVAPLAVLIRHSGDYVASGATGLERDSMFAMFGPTDVQISMDPAQIGEIFPRLEVPTLARALRGEQLEILGVVIVRGGLPRESLLAFGCICDLLTLRLREIERRVVDRLRIEALSEQLDKYHGFIAKVSEGIWRCDLPTPVPIDWDPERQVEYIFENGVMAECNETMAKMYGFDRSEEILGLALRQLLLPGEPQNRDYLKKFIKNGYRLNDSESIEQDRFGRPRYFVNNLVGVIEDAKLVGAWGTQRDVTAYKVLQEELTLAAQEAARANLAKSAFLANVSHELRTPLGIILGFADLALDGSDPTSEVHGFIEGIKRNGQLLAHILGEVLDLSKIEASRFEAESIRFALVPLLDEIVASMELNAHKKGLELRFERETPLPRFVRSDPMRLRQILNNLLSNAIKFTEKGAVVLSVRMLSPVRVGAPLEIGFSVKDSGIGISAEAAQRLFQPFSQADAATARKYGGTGLGLNLSRQLARMLGGDLLLKSSCEGNGSCFRLNLKVGEYDGELVYGGGNPDPAG